MKEISFTKDKGILLIAFLKLLRSFLAIGVASILYYIAKNTGKYDFNYLLEPLLNNQDVILTTIISFFEVLSSDVLFKIALIFLALGILRLCESIGLLLNQSWGSYSSILTGIIYTFLAIYLISQNFSWPLLILLIISILITGYLIFKLIETKSSN